MESFIAEHENSCQGFVMMKCCPFFGGALMANHSGTLEVKCVSHNGIGSSHRLIE
jgi:hypothetical protein